MVLRTAKTGRNAGGRFWGCPRFPLCRGTRDDSGESVQSGPLSSDADPSPDTPVQSSSLPSLPVAWIEEATRTDFVAEYVSVGAVPGVVHQHLSRDVRLERALGQCVLLSRRSHPRQAVEHARLASGLLVKMLQRGSTPLPTLEIERKALRVHGLLESVRDLKAEGMETGWEPRPGTRLSTSVEAVLAVATERTPFELDPTFGFDSGSDTALLQSDAEAWFLHEWVPDALGPSAGHWFTPQASLDKLLESGGKGVYGARRVDFLFSHPGGRPFVIEVDGPEHDSALEVDGARDDSLRSVGVDVLRVSNDEVTHDGGAVLDRIRDRCHAALTAFQATPGEDDAVAALVADCAVAAKVQFAVVRAVGFGWLTSGAEWKIDLIGGNAVHRAGVLDVLRLLAGIDVLYGGSSAPARCTVRCDGGVAVTWRLDGDGGWREAVESEAQGEKLRIAVETETSPFHRSLPDRNLDFVIRPVYLPVQFEAEFASDFARRAIAPAFFENARPALSTFLRNVFRKCDFRPMQGEAVFNALRQKDCVVLLPTGAGKSLVYQLAGLMMPGLTLVVDPLISLIEDQVEGLRAYGIDRAVPITSSLATREERRRLLTRVERGEYQFVLHSPERLQSPEFRETLRALSETSLVNLAVIDEAHCVSEWGHDYRPAYLNLSNNLRRLGADRDTYPPPLLALTGTASRAVLRDMLADLGIDRSRSDALIRPESFDRAELSFEIVHTSPTEYPQAALRGVLNSLPGKFGLPRAEFYRSSGRNTASGIVFVPTVNAKVFGLTDARDVVRKATGTGVTLYSGGPPRGIDNSDKWDTEKRDNAARFKSNRVPVLVATKAFGMGIDKPNIRYTVHFGMPGSLESFYQEAGRAGRDRQSARCTVIFSEYDHNRTDELLSPDRDLEELRTLSEKASRNRQLDDDVTRALFFHLRTFDGMEREIHDVESMLDEIGELSARRQVRLPFGKNDDGLKGRERAICRLLRLGVIRDYEVEYGRRQFTIHVEKFDLDRCRGSLLEYVRAAQPAKGRLFARRAAKLDSGGPRDAVFALARMLIEFTYDVVERSRRRMIQESALLARQCKNDEDIRVRLLDYLQEGLGAERIEQLLGSEEIDLAAWWGLVDKVQTPMDAGELRGLCIRALESYPDHPGLLLVRATAESMCSDHDDAVSSQELGAAIRTSIAKYELAQPEVEAIIDGLFDLALTRAPDLGLPLTFALLGLDNGEHDGEHRHLAFASKMGLARAHELGDPRVRVATTARAFRGTVDQLESLVDRVVRRYDTPEVAKALEGA